MASRGQSTWWLRLIVTVAAVSTWWQLANSDPQINYPPARGCSGVSNKTVDFFSRLNATFSDLRTRLSEDRRFAEAERVSSSEPAYAMVQCRKYLSLSDCMDCYDAAVSEIRKCATSTGARVTYDGCFLRYEAYNFYTKSNDNNLMCDNPSTSVAFRSGGQKLLWELQLATPKIDGYFAASKKEIANENLVVYGMAQCVESLSEDGCRGCMKAAYETIMSADCLNSADGRLTDAGCFMRFSNKPFFNQTTDIRPFLRKSSKIKAIIGGTVGGAGLAIIVVVLLMSYIFSRKLRIAKRVDILGATELQNPNRYSYKDLEEATNYFSDENKLGQGGFGVVYKATLKNGIIVAVKKLDTNYSRAEKDFESEVRLISNVHHRNLVRLLGCCAKGSELLLVYEYMENGSLDRSLYGDKRGSLTWKQRLDIIFGTARGIAYLHELYHETIIHRDIKPGNILLDDNFQAKIADFGLARLLPESQSHVSTKFAGTMGYTAPEYATHGHLSEKVDVYSFGVVTLEIISGRRSTDFDENSDTGYLLEEARKLYECGMHHKLADDALESDEYEPDDVKKLVEIALACTESLPSSRPTMSEILAMLLSHRSVEGRALFRPPLIRSVNRVGENASNATASISHFTGR